MTAQIISIDLELYYLNFRELIFNISLPVTIAIYKVIHVND